MHLRVKGNLILPPLDGRRYSHVPADLELPYAVTRRAPDIESLDDEIAILIATQSQLLRELQNSTEIPELTNAAKAYATLREVFNDGGSHEDLEPFVERLGQAITKGIQAKKVRAELRESFELQRKMVESRHRILGSITPEQAYSIVTSVAEIVRRFVKDPADLRMITLELRQLVVRRPDPIDVTESA